MKIESIDLQRWTVECAEWDSILNEMRSAGKRPSAFDVTFEQRKRMLARGESPMIPTPAEFEF